MASQDDLVRLQQTLYASRNPTRRWLHCTRRDWICEAIRHHAPERRSRALEVGPGSGVYLPTLLGMFEQVVATDVEAAYLKHLESLSSEQPNLDLLIDDIRASKLPSESVDLILCSEVIEHISGSERALSEMRRILRPRGVLVLSTPQPFSPLELASRVAFLPGIIDLVRLIYREPILETGHINLMSSKVVERELHEAGFCVTARHKSGLYLPLIAEFLGEHGLRIEQWLEHRMRNRAIDKLLWVQYYVARPDGE